MIVDQKIEPAGITPVTNWPLVPWAPTIFTTYSENGEPQPKAYLQAWEYFEAFLRGRLYDIEEAVHPFFHYEMGRTSVPLGSWPDEKLRLTIDHHHDTNRRAIASLLRRAYDDPIILMALSPRGRRRRPAFWKRVCIMHHNFVPA